MQNTTQTTDATRQYKTALIIAMLLLFILQPVTAQAQDAEENLFWESVIFEQGEEVAPYLELYPNGAYVNEAHDCLRAIAATATATATATKDSAVQKIRQHLLQCAAHFQANRLLTGQGGNALACYKQVLQMAPANTQALAGITAIEDKYIAWARRELQGHDVDRAQTYVQRLKTLNEERAEVAELERRIAQQKRETQVAQKSARQRVEWAGKMVAIPAGRFRMGGLSGADDEDEKPVHNVRLSPFEMGAHEVTVGQFRAFVADSGYNAGNRWRSPGFTQSDRHPVVCVSYNDVQAFIGWLNNKSGGHYRLPTEAEWEYAARAGTTSQFSWGNSESQAGAYAWYGDNSGDGTHAVGGKRANPWGLYDMHGNVWEWVADWYDSDYYASGPATDPQGPGSGRGRVFRGGGWVSYARYLRSAIRVYSSPGLRDSYLGFRLVRQP